jgi:hypothetical protein
VSAAVHIGARLTGDELRLQTNLGALDPAYYPGVFAALAEHVGLAAEPMRKAVDDGGHKEHEEPDPRYPEIGRLIDAARRDWALWGDKLVAEVGTLLQEGKLLPLNTKNEKFLRKLFQDHEVKIVVRLAGYHPDHDTVAALQKAGLVSKDVEDRSYLDTAWKLGRGLEMLHAHQVKAKEAPTLESIVRQAVKYQLTAEDEEAIQYVKRRGAVFMRRPVAYATTEVERELNEEEFRAIRGAIAAGIEERYDYKRIAREVHEALKGNETLQNDMDRVVRTEMAFAHSHGAYTALKAQAKAAGHDDPEVYKFVSPGACRDCKRIWGLPSSPKHYRLSEVEAREAAGGNFRKPRREWGPVIGPVHPHCTEGPLQYYDASLVDAINAVSKDYEDWFKQKR